MVMSGWPNGRLVTGGVQTGKNDVQYIRTKLDRAIGSNDVVGATYEENYDETKGTGRRLRPQCGSFASVVPRGFMGSATSIARAT